MFRLRPLLNITIFVYLWLLRKAFDHLSQVHPVQRLQHWSTKLEIPELLVTFLIFVIFVIFITFITFVTFGEKLFEL